jgi:tetratricopeptide (TPR) repeat protein
LTRSANIFLSGLAVLLLLTSCESQRGLSERYGGEKRFFVADKMAGRILEESRTGRTQNTGEVVALFDSLVSDFPLEELADRGKYSRKEARAITQIVWKSSIRAAGLVSLSGDGPETVKRYKAIGERFGDDAWFGPVALYFRARAQEANGEWDEAMEAYGRILDGFLSGQRAIEAFDERMMEIPFLMMRLIEPSRDERTLGSVMERGREFFEWVGRSDSSLVVHSRLSAARTYAYEGRWRRHVSSLADLLGSSLPGLEALRPLVFVDVARAYKDGLGLSDSALSYCSLLTRDYASHPAAGEGLLLEASIMRDRGQLEQARKRLQSLARRRSSVSASAMLELGGLYEALGRWEDARAEYGSLRGFFPHSVHNYEGLLRVVRHYRATGDRAAMVRAAEEAVEFLRGEIGTLPGSEAGLMARGFLVDTYLLAGMSEKAAEELEVIAGLYGARGSGMLALLKAARIHREAGEQQKARDLLREFERRYGGTDAGRMLERDFF